MEEEAENIRKSIIAALQKMTQFMESMRDTAHKIGIFVTFFSRKKKRNGPKIAEENINLYLMHVFKSKSLSYIFILHTLHI